MAKQKKSGVESLREGEITNEFPFSSAPYTILCRKCIFVATRYCKQNKVNIPYMGGNYIPKIQYFFRKKSIISLPVVRGAGDF